MSCSKISYFHVDYSYSKMGHCVNIAEIQLQSQKKCHLDKGFNYIYISFCCQTVNLAIFGRLEKFLIVRSFYGDFLWTADASSWKHVGLYVGSISPSHKICFMYGSPVLTFAVEYVVKCCALVASYWFFYFILFSSKHLMSSLAFIIIFYFICVVVMETGKSGSLIDIILCPYFIIACLSYHFMIVYIHLIKITQ